MAAPMRSTDFRAIVEPILNEEFDGVYEQRDDEWNQVFKQVKGIPRTYHEEPVLYGFAAAPELPDGQPVTYQSGGVIFTQRYLYRVYGLAFALTKVLVEDGDHIRIGQIFSRHLAQSLIETKETLCANFLNRAFNAALRVKRGCVCLYSRRRRRGSRPPPRRPVPRLAPPRAQRRVRLATSARAANAPSRAGLFLLGRLWLRVCCGAAVAKLRAERASLRAAEVGAYVEPVPEHCD